MKLTKKNIVGLICFTYILVLPFWRDIHNPFLYSILSIGLLVLVVFRIHSETRHEESFFQKWHIARQRCYWVRLSLGTLKWVLFNTLLITIPFYVVGGYEPMRLIEGLLSNMPLILIISPIFGVMDYKANEKRYHAIRERMEEKRYHVPNQHPGFPEHQ